MASWRQTLAWWKEFRQLGTEDVRRRVQHVIWSEEKLRTARRWLWRQEHRLQVIGMIVTGLIAAPAAILAAIKLVEWLRS
jgi:hypothetical protein